MSNLEFIVSGQGEGRTGGKSGGRCCEIDKNSAPGAVFCIKWYHSVKVIVQQDLHVAAHELHGKDQSVWLVVGIVLSVFDVPGLAQL